MQRCGAYILWAVYAQMAIPLARALSHRQNYGAFGNQISPSHTSDQHVMLPIPTTDGSLKEQRLPTNEENQLNSVVENGSTNEDLDNLKEIQELMKNPVPEASVEQEKEDLQAEGALPTIEPFTVKPAKGSDEEKYSKGVSDTAQILDTASRTVESDGSSGEQDENERLKRELQESMEMLNELPSLDREVAPSQQ